MPLTLMSRQALDALISNRNQLATDLLEADSGSVPGISHRQLAMLRERLNQMNVIIAREGSAHRTMN